MQPQPDKLLTSDGIFRKMKRADLVQFIIIELLLFLMGTVFILASYTFVKAGEGDHSLAHYVTLELGIALITSCIIAGTVELFMRKGEERAHAKHRQEIAQNVFRALFGTAISDKLVNEMYAALFVPKFVREEIEIRYKFERLGDEPALPQDARKLRIHQVITYLARNVVDKPVSHPSSPREDILVYDAENEDTPFKDFLMEIVGRGGSKNTADTICLDTPAKLLAATTRQGMRYTLKRQTLEDIRPGEAVRAVLAIDKICRFADTDTWVTSTPAEGLTIKVEVAKDLAPVLEFCVDQAHRQKMIQIPESERTNQSTYEWRLDSPILPYQGVMLRWRPKQQFHI